GSIAVCQITDDRYIVPIQILTASMAATVYAKHNSYAAFLHQAANYGGSPLMDPPAHVEPAQRAVDHVSLSGKCAERAREIILLKLRVTEQRAACCGIGGSGRLSAFKQAIMYAIAEHIATSAQCHHSLEVAIADEELNS